MNHPPIEILIQHTLGLLTAPADLAHIESCSACADEVGGLGEIAGEGEPREIPDELAELEREVAQGREAVRRLMSETRVADLPAVIASSQYFQTDHGVSAVLSHLPAIRRTDPPAAMDAARALHRIVEARPDLRNHAVDVLREEACCARVLGKYDEASELLSSAERLAVESDAITDFALGRVWYERAALAMNDHQPLADWAEKATDVFLRYGDSVRLNRTRYLSAAAAVNQRRYRDAIALLEPLLQSVHGTDDQLETMSWSLLAQALTRENRIDEARSAFARAITGFESLGMAVDMLRASWAYASADLKLGLHEQAAGRLREVRARFKDLDLLEEYGLAGLDLTECLLLEGEDGEARRICSEALAILTEQFKGREQQRALAYLQEIARESVSLSEFQQVRTFLHRSIEDSALIFTPSCP